MDQMQLPLGDLDVTGDVSFVEPVAMEARGWLSRYDRTGQPVRHLFHNPPLAACGLRQRPNQLWWTSQSDHPPCPQCNQGEVHPP